MIGRTVGHYRILDHIGEGGMGQVFLAEDTSLNRKVALKFLPDHLLRDPLSHRRFLREAESAAALEHPYICNIKEVAQTQDGEDFIVMEYVGGDTLQEKIARGPLPVEEAQTIAEQILDALGMAHHEGIVHRDLKPANIMITPQGHVKVMDFGLAKRVTAQGDDQDLTTETGLTREGMTLGTPAYMSPEQIRSQPVDHRSDIFSLGIIFCEMLTGVHPFRRPQAIETLGAILHEEPQPLETHRSGLPAHWDATIRQMLAKEPDQRSRSAREVAAELASPSTGPPVTRKQPSQNRIVAGSAVLAMALAALIAWWAAGGRSADVHAPPIRSIAVLPLVNLSGDPAQDYFVDGMTETLITDLSQIGALKVIARKSSMLYRDSQAPLEQIGQELGVEALLEGSVLRENDQVRISAQLIDVSSRRNLWANRYERSVSSIMELQGEVAKAIVQELQITLTPAEESALERQQDVHPEAFEEYLKGQLYWYKMTEQDFDTALGYFERALEKDPEYALPYAGIASVWAARTYVGVTSREAVPEIRQAVLECLSLDSSVAACHFMAGTLATWFEWDWDKAEREFARALELDPNHADTRVFYGLYLSAMGRGQEAEAQLKKALDLDPLNFLFQTYLGNVYLRAGRVDEAIEQFEKGLALEPDFVDALDNIAGSFHHTGRYADALAAQRRFWSARAQELVVQALDSGYVDGGYTEAMRRAGEALASLSNPAYAEQIATLLVYGEDYEQALKWLQIGIQERLQDMVYLSVYPKWDPLRDDARFQEMVRQLHYPE